jgi:phosphoenolpyruvate carboxylase
MTTDQPRSKHPARRPLADPRRSVLPAGICGTIEDRLFTAGSGEPSKLAETLSTRLIEAQADAMRDPTANPILKLALDISASLSDGSVTYGMLEETVQYATMEAFSDRAAQLSAYIGETAIAGNEARIGAVIRRLAHDKSFEAFQAAVEAGVFGIVLTAHPTFSINSRLLHLLNRLATELLTPGERNELLAEAASIVHRPDPDLSLDMEHALSLEAVEHIRRALHHTYRLVLNIAEELYPDRWTTLVPRLITVASWVGYDLDGRSDISFADMLAKRLGTQARQLALLSAELAAIDTSALPEEASRSLDLLATRLELAASEISQEVSVFSHFHAEESESREAMRSLSRHLNDTRGRRPLAAAELAHLLDSAIAQAGDPDLVKRVMILRADLANNGLALARTHVRINATQLHNAIRKTVGLDTEPDDPRYRQSYLNAITQLIGEVQPATINFGTLLAERTSAKRLFMTVTQMLKYMDGAIPVRFLIAECETAFTPLVALYYARLFGIADRLEICPLFETEKALQMGSRVIEQLIDNPHFRAYLTEIGRLCVQTGYSDAGRFIGQPPATGSIERLKERIIRAFQKHNLTGIELVFFDTHGESIGRGGHPQGLARRFDYIHSPHLAHMIAERGIAYRQESSFQGGDGYVYFMNEAGALAVIATILEWRLAPPRETADPYYTDRDYITEFLTGIKEFQTGLIENPDYGVLLGTYGSNLLYKTGSRATKRTEFSETASRPQVSQFRAIPHNGVLQQLGMLTNTLGGAGEAIARDPAHFQHMYQASERFRVVVDMLRRADALSDADTLKAYVDTLDPGLWLLRSAASLDAAQSLAYRRIAGVLEDWGVHGEQVRMFRHLFEDFLQLRDGLQTLDEMPPALAVTDAAHLSLAMLNAIRLALIGEIYVLGTKVPEFSSRGDVANRRLFMKILQLDIPDAVESLRKIFPAHPSNLGEGDFGEDATYVSDDAQTYERENRLIFTPMLQLYELVRRIGTAIAYRMGAIG